MSEIITLSSYAKINLFLHIINKKQDGYHKLQTFFQFVDLRDYLQFSKNAHNTINIYSSDYISDIQDNLIYKAAKLIEEYATNYSGVDINIQKNIPMGAGLGGGSSNAAITLLALNKLWQCKLTQKELLKLGNKLGADVPIFIYGKSAWAEGIGDIFKPKIHEEQYILLIMPNIHVSTKDLFINENLDRQCKKIHPDNFNLKRTKNVFEKIFRAMHPDLAQVMDKCAQYAFTRLTGTGSCFYCLSQDLRLLQKLQKKLPKELDSNITKTLNFASVDKKLL